MENDDTPRANESTITPPGTSRRTFLKRASAAAIGVGMFGGIADRTTAAAVLPPEVSTRGYYSINARADPILADRYTKTGYNTLDAIPGLNTECDEVAILVHGWNNNESKAREMFGNAVLGLSNNGYSGVSIGYSWDSDVGVKSPYVWKAQQEIAIANATHLAQLIVDLRKRCMDHRIHLLGHSLGAEVILNALSVLNRRDDWLEWYKLHSVCLFGAAVHNEMPAAIPYYGGIRYETGRTFNFHSTKDSVLRGIYPVAAYDQALGRTGIESGEEPPKNYTDIDVTDSVGTDHSGYLGYASDEIVNGMQWE